MADKPLVINSHGRRLAAQNNPQLVLSCSFESAPTTLTAGEVLDVAGVSCLLAYGGGVATAYTDNTGSAVSAALFTPEGTAVNVTGAQLVDLRGVSHISFASGCTVVLAG